MDPQRYDMSHADIRNLAEIMDPNMQHERSRPEGQVTGYSLSTSSGGGAAARATDAETKGPGGIALPTTAVDIQIGLPVPSMSRAGRELQAQQERAARPLPRGDAIWADEEVTDVAAPADITGSSGRVAPVPTKGAAGRFHHSGPKEALGRAEPQYDVRLRQRIGTEDVYLGVDFERDGSTAASEGVVVRFQLPLTATASEISLDVKPFSLQLETPGHYFARVPLPLQVLEGKAAAQWDGATHTLTATLTADPHLSKVKVM